MLPFSHKSCFNLLVWLWGVFVYWHSVSIWPSVLLPLSHKSIFDLLVWLERIFVLPYLWVVHVYIYCGLAWFFVNLSILWHFSVMLWGFYPSSWLLFVLPFYFWGGTFYCGCGPWTCNGYSLLCYAMYWCIHLLLRMPAQDFFI